jgi:hypothetical protein
MHKALTTSADTRELLLLGLHGLDSVGPNMAQQAASFVVDGSEPSVLANIKKSKSKCGALLGSPGRLRWSFPADKMNAAQIEAGKACLAARHTLYYCAAKNSNWAGLLARLGAVLAASDDGVFFDRFNKAVPDHIQYLLNDALWATLPTAEDAWNASSRPAWDIDMVLALLEHEGLNEKLALSILFKPTGNGHPSDALPGLNLLVRDGALEAYMLANSKFVKEAFDDPWFSGSDRMANFVAVRPALRDAYADALIERAAYNGLGSRTAEAYGISALLPGKGVPKLEQLARGHAEPIHRVRACEVLERYLGESALPFLRSALDSEKNKGARLAIQFATNRLGRTDAPPAGMPAMPPLPVIADTPLGEDALQILLSNHRELLEELGARSAKEQSDGAYPAYGARCDYERQKKLTDAHLRRALQELNGSPSEATHDLLRWDEVRNTIYYQNRIPRLSSFTPYHAMRLAVSGPHNNYFNSYAAGKWLELHGRDNADLRAWSRVADACGGNVDDIATACLAFNVHSKDYSHQGTLKPELVWPLFAESPWLIDVALGLLPSGGDNPYGGMDFDATLRQLAKFPNLPERWMSALVDIAANGSKARRVPARAAVKDFPDLMERLISMLALPKAEKRLGAASWLGELGYRPAAAAMEAALSKEENDKVRIEMQLALKLLGSAGTKMVAPDDLLDQARVANAHDKKSLVPWLDFSKLPGCEWADGGSVPPEVIQWWLNLAVKTKQPGGNDVLDEYRVLIAPASRTALANEILAQFVAHDTALYTVEQATAKLKAEFPKMRGESLQYNLARTVEQYCATAIKEKGVLAFACDASGSKLAEAIGTYTRQHALRRAQIEALLECASKSDEPAAVHAITRIASGYKTNLIREKATALTQVVATRLGWTTEQLADRTAPTGGLDSNGRLEFCLGDSTFTVLLDDAMKLIILDSNGKKVAALPDAGEEEDEAPYREAKQTLSMARKDIKSVIDTQARMFHDAMCSERTWDSEEWFEFIQRHPVVGRFAQRLVWSCSGLTFRPAEDGALLGADDAEVTLPPGSSISLAHGIKLEPSLAKHWRKHFKDYKLKPLFEQMERVAPAVELVEGKEHILDREGWLSDTFTLRNAFRKLGYQHDQPGQRGFFTAYVKPFSAARVGVAIGFSGNHLPEENVTAALGEMRFFHLGTKEVMPLTQVPRVLLAEAYADYHAVASSCGGFDPAWKEKIPF